MEWAGIAGGRCPKALWRVGVAGASVDDPQRALVLTDTDWKWLSELLPLSVLHEYGNANGLSFEPLSGVDTQSFDALLLIVLSTESQQSVYVGSQSRRYLLLLDADQRLDAKYEQDFARIFMPAGGRFNDERLVCLNPAIDMAEPLTQRSFEAGQVVIYSRDVHDAGKAHFAYCHAPERSAGWLSDCWLDCLLTGMVPVHIADWPVPAWIPENSYVDGRRFPDRDTLELFLDTMAPEEYRAMVETMRHFRASPDSYPYSIDAWINALTAAVAADAAQARDEAPLISVIIPSYNYGRFIGQTVASVLAQGVQSLEVLVLDNASSDETAEVMRAFATDARVRFMGNRRNIGPSHNVLNGIRIATGQFMTVLMADDILLSGHFRRLLPLLQAHPEVAVGYAPVNYIDERGTSLASPPHPGHRAVDYVGGRNEVADLLIFDNYVTPSASIIRRHAFLTDWRWNPHLKGAGDWDMVVQLAEHNPDFIFTSTPGVGYRVHQAQHSTQFYASAAPLEDHVYIVEGVFERGSEGVLRGRELDVAAHLRRRLALYPSESNSALGVRVCNLCERLEALAALGESALFSIILTTYNRADLLKDALTSVGSQTLRDFEVILINDNGEPVEQLLAAYDFPVTYIRQGRNQGLSAARNAGLALARGRYIVYLDDDDIYLPNHLAVLAEAFEQHPGSVIYTGVEYVNERLEGGQRIELGRGQPFKHDTFDRDRLFVQNYIPVNTWAHPREMLATVGEFDTDLAAFEDWDMLLRLATRYPFVHVPTVTSEVHTRAPGAGGDHMLGRERKNFPALYRELYGRYAGSSSDGLQHEREKMLRSLGEPVRSDLAQWLVERLPTASENRQIGEYLQSHQGGPLIGVVVVDADGQSEALMVTLQSLIGERCLYSTLRILVITSADAPSTSATDKLHFLRMTDEPLAAQVNRAVEASDCQWFMLASAGDEFTQSGLMVAGLELARNPECRAVYGDQLQRLPDGNLGGAFLPGFNLDLLLSFPMVMARHWLFRRDLFRACGGFDVAFPDAFEFELLTRLIEQEGLAGLGHIDEPLLITDAPALRDNPDERRVIERHLGNRGYQAKVLPGLPGRYRVHYGHAATPPVSIVLSTDVPLAALQRCIESLLEKTAYAHYEVLLADDGNRPDVSAWLSEVAALGDDKVRVLAGGSGLAQNRAAEQARGEYLLLLGGDAAIVNADWLDELLNHAQRPEVGVVGGKLLTPGGRIAQAGLLLGLNGPATPAFAGESMEAAGYLHRLQVDQNYSAVGEACLMIRAELFQQLGGLDAQLAAFRDVDLCLRVRAAGYLTVWAANAIVLHEAEQPRADVAAEDQLYERYLPQLANDTAYNRNLALSGRGFDLESDVSLTWRPLSWRPSPVVLAHPADPWGCGHYRVIQPLAALKAQGLADGTLSMGLLTVTDFERYDPDVVVLQRQIGDERLEAMRRIQRFSRAFKIYELDDYLPNLPLKSVHRAQMPRDILKSLRRGLEFVDRFVVSTAPLAEAFAGLHGDIRVIENRLPVKWWKGLESQRRRGRKPRVGWAGGVSHTGDLDLIVDVVRELAGEVEWVFMGMCPDAIRPYVNEIHTGVDIESYPAALASLDLDLALAPVEQNLFNECKSNLRLLEYGACGFPVVCSDLVCYRGDLPVTRVKNRFRDWVDAIRMHINDLDAAAIAGDRLRDAVYRDWMLEGQNLQRWRQAWTPD
ncbi:glycosyltransferase [Ectopseudomonas composti]|uniref:glycosyltransferase n=1 Tax=Ectopseudomonas composti TaxID=658457 RepID=UPI000AB4BC13|nr:glycosyltransferase [Pseudomonas composti]